MNIAKIQYALLRFGAMLKKEMTEIKRDYVTYLFLILVPFLEVTMFGIIINTDAKNLPTVILMHDSSPFVNSLIQGFKTTEYFKIIEITKDDKHTESMLRSGKAQFVITSPPHFSSDIIRNKHPRVLVEGDATDPVAVGNAFNAANAIADRVLNNDLKGPLAALKNKEPLFYVDTHAVYNPAAFAQYHTVPGLLSTILAVTLVMLTAISITTEYERGTMEMLLITPITQLEVILGKIIPNVMLGYILFTLTILLSIYGFNVPFYGSFVLLAVCAIPYIMANLSIGLAISTVSRTQLRAANLANTYVLPALLLSGFMFPFNAMPNWAQWIGELLPTTHFMRITSAIMLKKASFLEIWSELWPIILFTVLVVSFSIKNYRKTLD